MKVFLFLKDKSLGQEDDEIREEEVKKYKITSMKNLEIHNPKHSSYIYIIHDLKISNYKSQDIKSAALYCNNSLKLKDMYFDDNNNKNLQLLSDEFVIILPGGKLGVEFNKELKNIQGEIKIEKKRL